MRYAKKHVITLLGADENAQAGPKEYYLSMQDMSGFLAMYDSLLFFRSHAHASLRDAVAADKLEPQYQKVIIGVRTLINSLSLQLSSAIPLVSAD
jgi:hypothetical protein